MSDTDFMAKENILSLLIRLSVPAAVAMIVNSLYNVIDTIFVGHGVGPLAIAALSIAFPIQMLIASVSQAIGVGASSIVSRRLGEGENEQAAVVSGTAITFSLVSGLIMTLLLVIFIDPILRLFGASENILPFAREYMLWVATGFFFLSFSMAAGGLVRAVGNAKVAMFSMLLGTIINIILDPIFIFVFEMGIKGAAIATVISQFISFVYLINFFLRGKGGLNLHKKHFRMKRKELIESFILGLPNFIQMSGMSLMMIVINNSLGRFGGDLQISSYGMISKLFGLLIMPIFGVVQGFQPIVGYNYGAREYKRVEQALVWSLILTTSISLVGWAMFNLFPEALMGMFTTDSALIETSAKSLKIFVGALFLLGFQLIGSTYFQAIGKKLPSLVLSLSRQFLILLPLLIILPYFLGLNGIWYSFPFADLLSAVITSIALAFELRHLKELHNRNSFKVELVDH